MAIFCSRNKIETCDNTDNLTKLSHPISFKKHHIKKGETRVFPRGLTCLSRTVLIRRVAVVPRTEAGILKSAMPAVLSNRSECNSRSPCANLTRRVRDFSFVRGEGELRDQAKCHGDIKFRRENFKRIKS